MVQAGINFPKTHDLIRLLGLAVSVAPQWVALHPFVVVVNPYAVGYRYPGLSATKTDAKAAINACKEVLRRVRMALGLQSESF